jgi:hypothetical protein
MKTKGKSKGESESKKAIIGIALAAIMLASVFAGISASAVADNNNNTANESGNDNGNIEIVESQVEEEAVMGAEAGTLSVELGTKSPSENIDNSTHENESVFQLRFGATGESIRINNLTVNQTGSIPASQNLTNISVWVDDNDGKWGGADVLAGYINASDGNFANNTDLTIELSPAIEVLKDAQKDVIICVNTTKFELGKTIQMKLESFNATGVASNEPATQNWIDPAPISSYLIKGTGNVTVSRGAQDVNVINTEFPFVDAGNNSDVINRTVIMQINFTAGIETSKLQNVTLQWNTSAPNAANSSKDIDSVYLVNDTNADGKWNTSVASEKIVTTPTSFTNNVSKLEITVPTDNEISVNANRTYLIVVNTTKTFWSNESLAVNITDFNATSAAGYIVSKKYVPEDPLASNVTIGRAKIKVEFGDKQPVYTYIPAAMNQTNMEIMQLNFTVTAGEINITHVRLQANSTMKTPDANNTWPRIWWDKNNDGYITHLINRSESDVPLNTTGNFNLSKELNPYGVNVNLTLAGNLTIGGNETSFGDVGFDSQQIVIAFNTTLDLPPTPNMTKIEINRTTTGYNYTAIDTIAKISINDTSDYFNAKTLTASNMADPNPFWIELHDNSPSTGGVKAGENTNLPVMLLNLTNMQALAVKPDLYIHSITVTENGTANATMIKNVSLCIDTNGDGKYDGETIIASKTFTRDNSSVTLTPATAIVIDPVYQSKYLLILVNTTDKFTLEKTLRFNVSDPSLDCNATAQGTTFGVTNQSTSAINGNALAGTGTIAASLGANTPPDGTVSSEVNATFLSLMQLNFTAGDPEDVNVTSLTITWNGTGISGENATWSIGIANDTDANGEIDWGLGETVINKTTFAGNTSVHDLSTWANVTKGNTSSILIYVNTTAGNLTVGDTLAINISNPSTNYSAKGATSDKAINDTSTTAISSKRLTAYWTGEILIDQLALETDTIIKNETNNNVVLLRFNLTAKNETVNVTSIKIRGMGGINETVNVTGVALRTPADGNVISDRKDFETDDGYVNLTISPALTVVNTTEVDVIANITTTSLSAGDNITVGLYRPATDLKAVGYFSGVPIQNTTVTALSNITVVVGNVTVTTEWTPSSPITAMAQNDTEILRLNFSAFYESVNITGINVTWIGSPNATAGNITIGARNITNANAPVLLVVATFDVNNVSNLSLTPANLTIVNESYGVMSIYLNVTENYVFNLTDKLRINLTNYVAVGTTTNKTLKPYGVPIESGIWEGTGNLTVIDTGEPPNANIVAGVNYTVPVWQLNMSTNLENATLENITLWFNGSHLEDIAKVDLYNDTNANATVDANETIIATNLTAISDDGKVILNLTKTIYIYNTTVQSFLVTVNTTSSFKDNHTIGFNITRNSSADVRAKGLVSGIVMATNYTVPMNSSILTGKCCIDVYNMSTQPPGPVYANKSVTNVEVLKLNFSAPCCNVDILNITLQENGTAKVKDDPRGVTNISVWYDSKCYNSTAQFATEDGSLVINTTGLKLNCLPTNVVTITVNTTDKLTTGQTLIFKVNRTLGIGYNATCNESQQTPYSDETGEINNTITVTAAPAADTISLEAGWNLISLWLIPANTSIEVVTADILDNLDNRSGVWAYDAQTGWHSYRPGAPPDLTEMTTGWGYWIKMNATDTLPVTGKFLPDPPETPPTYTVYKGWNLIGFHSLNESRVNATDYLDGVSWKPPMYKYNAVTDQYEWTRGTDAMEQGKGYWVAVTDAEATIYPY